MTRTLLSLVLKALQKITCIGLLLWPLPAFSLVVDGLYDAAIQVEDQSPEPVSYTHLTLPTNREV